jgi:hypothetical protein
MNESLHAKALRAIGEERVLVLKANESGIALDVISSKPSPATLTRATYRTLVYTEGGTIRRSCTCPAPRRCYHIAAAELIWKPGPHERSDR